MSSFINNFLGWSKTERFANNKIHVYITKNLKIDFGRTENIVGKNVGCQHF